MITNGSLLYWSQLSTDDEDADNHGGGGGYGSDDNNDTKGMTVLCVNNSGKPSFEEENIF